MEVYSDPVDRFGLLCRYLGARSVAENLGVDEEFVARVLAGEEELEEHHVGELEDLFYLVRDVVGGDAGSGEPVVAVVDGAGSGARRARAASVAAAAAAANDSGGAAATEVPEAGAIVVRNVSQVPSELALGVDLDGDNIPDVSLAGMVSGRPGVGWRDEQDKRRIPLRNARALAVMTMFRLYRLQRSPLCRFASRSEPFTLEEFVVRGHQCFDMKEQDIGPFIFAFTQHTGEFLSGHETPPPGPILRRLGGLHGCCAVVTERHVLAAQWVHCDRFPTTVGAGPPGLSTLLLLGGFDPPSGGCSGPLSPWFCHCLPPPLSGGYIHCNHVHRGAQNGQQRGAHSGFSPSRGGV